MGLGGTIWRNVKIVFGLIGFIVNLVLLVSFLYIIAMVCYELLYLKYIKTINLDNLLENIFWIVMIVLFIIPFLIASAGLSGIASGWFYKLVKFNIKNVPYMYVKDLILSFKYTLFFTAIYGFVLWAGWNNITQMLSSQSVLEKLAGFAFVAQPFLPLEAYLLTLRNIIEIKMEQSEQDLRESYLRGQLA